VNNAPTRLRQRRRNGVIVALALVAVLLLIAVSSLFFGARSVPEEPVEGPSGIWPGGGDFAEDFRKFFEEYYTPFDEAKKCTIPRVESYPRLELALRAPGGGELTLREVYEKCAPSVVAITAFVDESSDDSYFWGTGIVLSSDGYIVTNSHVVEGSCRARVTLWNDEEYDVLLVGNDSRSDIAVLKIDAKGLAPAEFCDGEDLAVGDRVVAIGNPLGEQFRSTMTEGIISGIDRGVHYNGTTLTLLQTSTPINEGNSGGPLINMYGQVIGITNMKMSAKYAGSVSIEGVGFAIPSRTVKTMADSILANGEVIGRPALGVTVGDIPSAAKKNYELPGGLYVSAVADGSDAKKKGLQTGDILTEVNGEPIADTAQLTELIAGSQVGDVLHFTVWRQEDSKEIITFAMDIVLVDVNDVY